MVDEVLRVTISRTADNKQDYIQVLSQDGIAVNVVLIAHEIIVFDARPKPKKKGTP